MLYHRISGTMTLDMLVISFSIVFLIQLVFFFLAATFKTDKFTDLSYGLTFVVLAWFLLFSTQKIYFHQVILTLMITIWGIRLAGYLFIRVLKTKKDKRFDGIRENVNKFAVFWALQAVSIVVIMLPSIAILTSTVSVSYSLLVCVGFSLWLSGLLIETLADQQKYKFKSDPKNKEKWIQEGIWKYSRHPNYFGEMLVWWGIFIYAIPYLSGALWLVIIGPVYLTYILLYVTGVPSLEKKYDVRYKGNKEYESYKKSTSMIIPLPRR